MSEQQIDRLRPDEREDEIGMMSTPISLDAWGEEIEGPYAGYATGLSLGMTIRSHAGEILGGDDFDRRVYDAIGEVLADYPGAEWTNDDGEYLSVEFGLPYDGDETTDHLISRVAGETGFRRLYDDAVIMFTFSEKLAEKLGRRRYVNDFDGDGWVDIDDETPDVYSCAGERHVVPHLP